MKTLSTMRNFVVRSTLDQGDHVTITTLEATVATVDDVKKTTRSNQSTKHS